MTKKKGGEEQQTKEEKKLEKRKKKQSEEDERKRKKDLKKSKESVFKKSRESVLTVDTLDSPRSGECLSSGKKKGGLFKRISSYMSPGHARRVPGSQSCQDLGLSPQSSGLAAASHSSPDLLAEGPASLLRNDSIVSVEYSFPVGHRSPTGGAASQPDSPRSMSPASPKTTAAERRRISFADEDSPRRVITPEILKLDLSSRLGDHIPSPPGSPVLVTVEMPDHEELEGLPVEERCEEQRKLLLDYENNIAHFRDQVLEVVAENSRLRAALQTSNGQEIDTVRRQAQHVLQENRALIKEQQMNQAQWQDLIEERNKEVLRVRNTCTNLEEQNETFQRRCEKLESKNEELRDAYNSIVSLATQADDFVSVAAHLSAVEGYKVALEELRRRYDENIADRSDEIGSLEGEVAKLSQRVEMLEGERAMSLGQLKGLQEALERSQRSNTKHKRETVALTQRVNTLKGSLAQAISIAEQSTLQRLELAEISDTQEKQKRSYLKESSDLRVKEVKKIANAKLKSCAEILQEKEVEHEKTMTKLYDKISRLKMQCQTKDDMIQSLSGESRSVSPS